MGPSGLLEYESLRPRPECGCILASVCQVRNCVAGNTKASCEQDAADAFHVLLACSWEAQGPEFILWGVGGGVLIPASVKQELDCSLIY